MPPKNKYWKDHEARFVANVVQETAALPTRKRKKNYPKGASPPQSESDGEEDTQKTFVKLYYKWNVHMTQRISGLIVTIQRTQLKSKARRIMTNVWRRVKRSESLNYLLVFDYCLSATSHINTLPQTDKDVSARQSIWFWVYEAEEESSQLELF